MIPKLVNCFSYTFSCTEFVATPVDCSATLVQVTDGAIKVISERADKRLGKQRRLGIRNLSKEKQAQESLAAVINIKHCL